MRLQRRAPHLKGNSFLILYIISLLIVIKWSEKKEKNKVKGIDGGISLRVIKKTWWFVKIFNHLTVPQVVLPSHTTDIDECLTRPCHQQASCTNTNGGHICSCLPGWTGNGTSCTGMHFIGIPMGLNLQKSIFTSLKFLLIICLLLKTCGTYQFK